VGLPALRARDPDDAILPVDPVPLKAEQVATLRIPRIVTTPQARMHRELDGVTEKRRAGDLRGLGE
jgi:hypothetical protein